MIKGMKTIGEVRVARQELEDKILKLMVDFNKETDTPISNVNVNVDRVSTMLHQDSYTYTVMLELDL